MSFPSLHAPKIWDKLYTVLIPDQLTLNKDYLSKFGTHITGVRQVDSMLSTNLTTVKIPVIRILEYYEEGYLIQIPSREDMLTMHKDIESYLSEWRDHIKYDINLSLSQNRELLLSLEKLSRYLYDKAKPSELIDNLFTKNTLGMVINPLQQIEAARKVPNKPDYEGISSLIKSKTKPQGRFG